MQSIYHSLKESRLLGTFAAAVEVLGLSELLMSEEYLTVFAPSDEAFRTLSRERVDEMLESKESLLANIANHIVPGRILTHELDGLHSVNTVMKNQLLVESGAERYVSDARITIPNLECSNGVIHIVDRVLVITKHRKAPRGPETYAARNFL